MSMHSVIKMILLESFESDKNELIELYPDSAAQISQLGPKWIMWLSSRFGLLPKREEVHPFEDALATILAFSKKDSAIGQKYKSSEQWRNAVDAQFPERKWATPADAMTMTVDDMETLLAMSERKKQNVDASSAKVDADFLAKVGPWNLWMPTTRENSCAIAGVDKLTGKPATTWCTARTSGSNLFYNYVARGNQNIVLFYLIRDDATSANDRISIGFIDGKPQIDGKYGGVTVNGTNDGMNDKSLKSVMGSFYEPIMSILTKKSVEIAGEHPAKGKIKDAAMSLVAFADILRGLSAEEATDLKQTIANQEKISEEVLMQLAGDADSSIRTEVAGNPHVSKEVLMQLAKDKENAVRSSVAINKNAPVEVLAQLAKDTDTHVRYMVAANHNTPAEILAQFAKIKDRNMKHTVASNRNTPVEFLAQFAKDENDSVRSTVAFNPSTPTKILAQLAGDANYHVRKYIALNKITPAEILKLLATDVSDSVRQSVASNKNTPAEILKLLALDKDVNIRCSVARNKNTPIEILEQLAEDENQFVRSDAIINLKERYVYEAVILKILKSKR